VHVGGIVTEYQVIQLRTGQLRRVSNYEMELAVSAARDVVEAAGLEHTMLEDKTRFAIALIALLQDRDYWKARALARMT
jgi:hypothetical protein